MFRSSQGAETDPYQDGGPEGFELRCEECHVPLASGEGQFCARCEPDWWVCPECHGKGYVAQCRYCLWGECNCDAECRYCDGRGRVLLSLADVESSGQEFVKFIK